MLKEVSAITYLRDFPTDGHKPILVLADDNNKYVIKPVKNINFDYSIYNEILCHFLLRKWKLNTPDIALVKVQKEISTNSINASSYKKSAYNNFFFGSYFYENSIELTAYLSFNKKIDYKKLINPEKLIDLGLFDIWVENDDRKPSNYNIILSPENDRFELLAIDNALTFSSLDYQKLNPNYISNSVNDNVLYSEIGKKIIKNIKPNAKWVSHKKDLFYLWIENCNKDFDEIINNITPFYSIDKIDLEKLKAFLFNEQRNNLVFQDFISRIKQ